MDERVLKMVKAKIDEFKDHLADGRGISDFSAYQRLVGKIQGLQCIHEIHDQIESENEKELTGIIS